MPAIAGGKLSWIISAIYNSKLWNMLRQEHAGSGFKQSYTYDRWGNRTIDQTNTFGTAVNNKQFLVNVATNRLTTPTGETGQMVYDDAGNLTKDTYSAAAAHRVYDAENRMLSETQAGGNVVGNYTYNGDGQRVRRKLVNSEIWQVYGFEGELLAEYEVSQSCRRGVCSIRTTLSTEYGYRSGQLLVVHSADNFYEPRWLVTDQLGTPRMIVDKTGALSNVKRHDYLPFGEELTTQTGRNSASGYEDDVVRQKFTSKERDDETKLDYFLARYYSSTQGRFSSPDEFSGGPAELFDFSENAADNPTFYADITNPQSLNKYQYTYNNPTNLTDDDGHCPLCVVVTAAVVVLEVVSSADTTQAPTRNPKEPRPLPESGDGVKTLFANVTVGTVGGPIVSKAGRGVLEFALARKSTEVVERAMSKAELKATQETGLVRGGREGEHYVTNSVSKSATKAQQRLALKTKPDVGVQLEVSKGIFSKAARVQAIKHPKGGVLPGGGLERKATGKIAAKVKKVTNLED